MVILFIIILVLSILGYFVEHKSLGNKKNYNAMVEVCEEDAPNKICLET